MNTNHEVDRIVHTTAGVGPLLFFTIATVEGFLRPGYDAIVQPISALALGSRGWVQELNFALLGISFLAFALLLRRRLNRGAAALAGPTIFVLMTIGVALAGLFRMDAAGTSHTTAGTFHLVGGFLVFPWIPVVLLLVARRFRHDPAWQPYFGYTLVTGLFSLATIVFFLSLVGPPGFPRPYPELAGIVQRVQLFPFFVWIAAVAHRASRANRLALEPRGRDASGALVGQARTSS